MKLLRELIGDNPLRALSWKEPYGSLMLPPVNKIETRTWDTSYRGWVLMCASQVGYSRRTVFFISTDQTNRINAVFGYDDMYKGHGFLGHAFAVGYLEHTRPMAKTDEAATYVTYHPDLFCHVYKQVQEIQPFPWKGYQRWSIVSPEIINQIILL